MLALAGALAAAGHFTEARQTLLRLRERSPESGEINLQLARLEARAGEHDSAVRYYRHAIFGVWPVNYSANQRTDVRKELIGFLLDIQDKSQALSELLILSSEAADTVAAHNDLGGLFLTAGDSRHALEQFTRALQLEDKDATALSGAGEASFNLGEYAKARRYLESALKNGSDDPRALLEITKLVLTKDPLGSAIRTRDRIARLEEDIKFVSDELAGCLSSKANDQSSLVILEPLWAELVRARDSQFLPGILRNDPEEFITALNLIHRIETATTEICGDASSFHKALVLIAAKHGAVEQ
jgi:tetratricopeptide (TPR) repeat protein